MTRGTSGVLLKATICTFEVWPRGHSSKGRMEFISTHLHTPRWEAAASAQLPAAADVSGASTEAPTRRGPTLHQLWRLQVITGYYLLCPGFLKLSDT
jgi:hypothetical protein